MTIIVTGGAGFIGGNFMAISHMGRSNEGPGISLQTDIVISGEYQNYYEKMYSNR